MYDVDTLDRVIPLDGVPQCSTGAPCPHIVAGENVIWLAYLSENPPPDWGGSSVRVVGPDSEGEPVVAVEFKRAYAHMFGPPNDEAFAGHPLARRGLRPYGAFRIEASSWVRRLERMNAVHPHHDPTTFDRLVHYVFTFHDSTFECVAESLVVSVGLKSVRATLAAFAAAT